MNKNSNIQKIITNDVYTISIIKAYHVSKVSKLVSPKQYLLECRSEHTEIDTINLRHLRVNGIYEVLNEKSKDKISENQTGTLKGFN